MFFDVHAHVYRYPYPDSGRMLFMTPEQLATHNKKYGIDQSVLLPLVSPEVYVPQSVGEVIDIAKQSGGAFLPFLNLDPRVLTNASDAPIGTLLEFYKKQGCLGIGEVLPNLEWQDAKMQNLLSCAEKAELPLLFDMTGNYGRGYGICDQPGMPQLEGCLNKYPGLTFIGHGPAFWAEIAALRDPSDRHRYPDYPVDSEGRVPDLLRAYENLWVDLSAGSGANAMMRDKAYAIHFLNEFSGRVMFGSDTCYVGQPLPIVAFLLELRDEGSLSPAVFEAIASKNAKRLLKIG